MSQQARTILTRVLTGFVLLFYLLRWTEKVTPSGLSGPPLFNLGTDITYWGYWLLDIPSVILYSKAGAVVFDTLVFITGIMVLLFPLRRGWIILFSLLIILSAISFNTVVLLHTVTVNGLLLVYLPFWIGDNVKFELAWQGIRYYCCFIWFMAFCWKTCIGNAFYYGQQGIGTFKMNVVYYLYYNPDTPLAAFFRWSIRHEWFLNAGNIVVVLLEGIMVIGLLTRRYDSVLVWLPVVITVLTYLFADVFIPELLVLNFAFVRATQWEELGRKFSVLSYPYLYAQKSN